MSLVERNITCRRCRHRHPASRSCEEAKRLADEAAATRAEIDKKHPRTRVVEIILDEDEPYFVLRGNSPLSPQLVQIWAACAKLVGGAHPEKLRQAYQAAEDMRAYLSKHDRQEFPILAAIEQSLVLGVEDATPTTISEETH